MWTTIARLIGQILTPILVPILLKVIEELFRNEQKPEIAKVDPELKEEADAAFDGHRDALAEFARVYGGQHTSGDNETRDSGGAP